MHTINSKDINILIIENSENTLFKKNLEKKIFKHKMYINRGKSWLC